MFTFTAKLAFFPLAAGASLLLVGCGTSRRTPVYDRSQVGQIISEQSGEILAVQEVVIKAPTSRAGSAGAGSRIGSAAAGAAISGNPVAIAVAASQIIGGAAGAIADNQRGEELTILLKDGRTVVIVQERGRVPFGVGDRVRIMSGGTHDRVVRDETAGTNY